MRKSQPHPVALAIDAPPLPVVLPTLTAAPVFAACIGIDRADRKLDICLQATPATGLAAAAPEIQVLPNKPAELHQWVAQLRQRFEGQPVAIGFEQPAPALLHFFLGYDFVTVYALNPVVLAKYRQAFTPSRAKDDTRDAGYLMELVRDHRAKLRAFRSDDVATRSLTTLSEARRKAVQLRTRLANMLRDHLKVHFPQALDLIGDDLHCALSCDFLLKWPTLQAVQRARPATVRAFYNAHQSRSQTRNDARLALLASTRPLSDDAALAACGALTTTMLATQLQALIPAIAAFDTQLAALLAEHPDTFIFASLPGAGAVHTARLAAAFGTDRSRFSSAEEVARYTGIAPIIKQSGQSLVVQRRHARSKFLHQSLLEYAHQSRLHCAWANAHYEQQRARGKSHYAAVRSLAYKWIRILFRCWQDRVAYDEAAYLAALQRHDSPLLTPPTPPAPAASGAKGAKRNVTVQPRAQAATMKAVKHYAPTSLA